VSLTGRFEMRAAHASIDKWRKAAALEGRSLGSWLRHLANEYAANELLLRKLKGRKVKR
jgi:hypothetical protein